MDVESGFVKGDYIKSVINKMIVLSDSNTKELDKQLKNVHSDDEVKNILGL